MKCDEVLISQAQRACKSSMQVHDVGIVINTYRCIEGLLVDERFKDRLEKHERWKEMWNNCERRLQIFINTGKI